MDGDKVTGLDWTGVDEPDLATPVQRLVLKEGTGAAVEASDTVTVNYFGETYQANEPFDESYTKTPLNSPLSGLIPGWSIGLTGVKVGSRVLLQIPPAYGYGAEGSGDSIPAERDAVVRDRRRQREVATTYVRPNGSVQV